MMDNVVVPVVAGLAAGIGFVMLFSLLYSNSPFAMIHTPANLEPRISQEQAIRTSESEIAKNRWYFKYPVGSPLFVLDFNEGNYYPVLAFEQQQQEGRKIPLVLLYSNGTIADVNGQFSNTLETCKREKAAGYCEFINSLRGESRSARGIGRNLAYLVGLDLRSYTHLFVVDATDGRLLNTTIYLRPILYQGDIERDLGKLGEPKITQKQAISIVEDDLRKRNPDFHEITGIEYNREGYIPFQEFLSKNLDLPLMYIHPSGTILFVVNNTQPEMGYYCDFAQYPYCGFLPPFNLDSKGRLVYGIDLVWNGGIDIYAVDAHTGEIVDSSQLREEARR